MTRLLSKIDLSHIFNEALTVNMCEIFLKGALVCENTNINERDYHSFEFTC